MPRSRAAKASAAEVERVFEAWRARRPRPDVIRLTQERRDLVSSRIGLGYSADDLVAVVTWANDSQEEAALWLRGEHPRNRVAYMDLTNLLRIEKLGRRVEAALLWREGAGKSEPLQDASLYTLVRPS